MRKIYSSDLRYKDFTLPKRLLFDINGGDLCLILSIYVSFRKLSLAQLGNKCASGLRRAEARSIASALRISLSLSLSLSHLAQTAIAVLVLDIYFGITVLVLAEAITLNDDSFGYKKI